MEFYRRCLIQIFGILEEYEVGTEGQRTLLGPPPNPPEEEEVLKEPPAATSESNEEQRIPRRSAEDMEGASPLLTAAPTIDAKEEMKDGEPVVKEEMEVMEEQQEQAEPRPQQASKYDKLPIKVEEKGEEWEEVEERWAELGRPNGFTSGLLHWKAGGGDSTAHILTGDSTPTSLPAERRNQERGGGGDRQEEGSVVKNLPAGEGTPSGPPEGKTRRKEVEFCVLCCSSV